jgi:hypothetical protein
MNGYYYYYVRGYRFSNTVFYLSPLKKNEKKDSLLSVKSNLYIVKLRKKKEIKNDFHKEIILLYLYKKSFPVELFH